MQNLAMSRLNEEPRLGLGEVLGKTEQGYTLSTEYGTVSAGRAAGCLLEPEAGDQVLLVWTGAERTHILNILERGNPDRSLLAVPGELALRAEKVTVDGETSVEIRTSQFELSALSGLARLGSLRFIGGVVSSRVGRMKTVAERVETIAGRVIDRLGRRYTRVEEFEDAQMGRMRLLVKDLLTVRSRSTAVKARDRVELDAEKILIG